MNADKICFIACVNNEELYAKSLHYVKKLKIPKNLTIETLALRGQDSMAKGYNNAMCASDAKYKVYMHQDTLIINKNFIFDVLKIFKSNNKIGMMGVIGCRKIPPSGMWWEANPCCGKTYDSSCKEHKLKLLNPGGVNGEYVSVEGLDGLIMITQYDLPWREDIFDGWHFYDISQCLEFARNKYEVVIPKQELAWIIHECGIPNTKHYDYYRRILLNEYDIFKKRNKFFQINFPKILKKIRKRLAYSQNERQENDFRYDDKIFHENIFAASLAAAETIVPILTKLFNPKSVVDVGCGLGAWLSVFQNQGIDVTGVGGDYIPRKMLYIDDKFFVQGDLSAQIPVNNRYDMAISLEIAGALPEKRAQSFVKELTDLAPIIVFSAPVPYERIHFDKGVQWVNLQWPDYWANLFKYYDYYAFDIIRPQIWDKDIIDTQYKTNMILYCNKTIIEKYPELLQWKNNIEKDISFNVVHQDDYIEQIRSLRYYKKKFRNYKKRISALALICTVFFALIILMLAWRRGGFIDMW